MLCKVRIRGAIGIRMMVFKYPTDYAIQNNLSPFISMQNHYNLVYREEEREMFPTLKVRAPCARRLVRALTTQVSCAIASWGRSDSMVPARPWVRDAPTLGADKARKS